MRTLTLYSSRAFLKEFSDKQEKIIPLEFPCQYADIVCFVPKLILPKESALFFFDASFPPLKSAQFSTDAALSCGMSARDTLSFSAIGETQALLSLTRSFSFLGTDFEPMELRVPFRKDRSLYHNLTHAFITHIIHTQTT